MFEVTVEYAGRLRVERVEAANYSTEMGVLQFYSLNGRKTIAYRTWVKVIPGR